MADRRTARRPFGRTDSRRASAASLLAADLKLHDDGLIVGDYLWLRTTIDGAVLPADPATLLRAATARPLLIGTNAFELDLPGGRGMRDAFLARSYGSAEPGARALYGIKGGDPAPDPRLGDVNQRIATDATFACPAQRFAAIAAARGAAVWYLFDVGTEGGMTAHCRELPYVFGDARLAAVDMQRMWASFVATGSPDGGWPRFPARERFDAAGAHAEPARPSPLLRPGRIRCDDRSPAYLECSGRDAVYRPADAGRR